MTIHIDSLQLTWIPGAVSLGINLSIPTPTHTYHPLKIDQSCNLAYLTMECIQYEVVDALFFNS